LEAEKIRKEHDDLQAQIADLQDILARRERILEIIEGEALEIKTKFGTPRRTEIQHAEGEIDETDLIANEKALILLTEQGYIKRMPVSTFEAQNRGTRGKAGNKMKEDDGVEHFLTCCDHDTVLFFSDRGVVYSLSAYQIPTGSRTARGSAIVQMLPIPVTEKITSMVAVSQFSEDEYLIMLTKAGFIKKTVLSAFSNIRANGLIAISLEDGDQLRWVRLARAEDSIIIGTRKGMAIHFKADGTQLRPTGRTARGVKSMKFAKDDELISMDILLGSVIANLAQSSGEDLEIDEDEELEAVVEEETENDGLEIEDAGEETGEEIEITEQESELNSQQGLWILVITTGGYGKRVPFSQFRLQNRAGKGVIATKFKSRRSGDQLAALRVVNEGDELMMVTSRGIIIRQAVNAISPQSRSGTGVRVQRLDEDDAIAAVALVPPSNGEEEEVAE
jgi:DNA gyrase subunit A